MLAVFREDFFVWRLSRSSNFSIKSAYQLALLEKSKRSQPEAFNQPSLNPLKEKVWTVLTLPKIRVFLWKALNRALPVAELLEARGMKVDARCQICGVEGDTINHTLFTCSVARHVWAISGIPNPQFGFHEISVYVNVSYLLNLKQSRLGDRPDFRVWPWILWMLWKSRNEFMCKGSLLDPSTILERALQGAEEWFEAQKIEKFFLAELNEKPRHVRAKWKPPPSGWKMCNVGFEWNRSNLMVGGGWVVRNKRGVVQCHSRRAFRNFHSLDEAKLVVILWALESMGSQRMSNIIVAGDFSELVGAVERPQAWPSFLHQVGEIELAMARIEGCRLIYVDNEANKGATFISQSVTRQGLIRSYVQNGHPPWLFELFVNESRFL